MSSSLHLMISLYLFVVGLVFGSFATLVGDRVVRSESIVHPGSHCTNCGRKLRGHELIPVISWLVLRGRCATCKHDISVRYPAQELTLAIAVVLSFWQEPSIFTAIVSCFLWFVFVIAMSTDFTALIVPNWLTYSSAFVIYVAMILVCHSVWKPLVGMFVGFMMIFLVHILSKGKMGLGDAKLYLSIGAFLGPALTVESFVVAAFIGTSVGGTLRFTKRLPANHYIPFVPFIVASVGLTQFILNGVPAWYEHVVLGL
ncbi:prepilin peptidase [Alicyclobacillus dauci]|uniref:Prepilin peptidase n=1 Tax=Alicyclobacillus dauci TaxID=1475485 RepID=A0ABY6Z8V2_9BACL|nr:A24 family peptidase [Alicyclobacillus dauci]WAH38958.1 prepilin peptidase [Alicyclobacillus dauci]